MPSHDAAIECQYLGFQCHQLGTHGGNAGARHFRKPGVIDIGSDFQQLSTPLRPTGATIPNSARQARIELIIAVCCRMNSNRKCVTRKDRPLP
jgi:hypothetical protein